MKIGHQTVSNYMTLKFQFPGIRILDRTLSPNHWILSASLVAMGEAGPDNSLETLQDTGHLAYQKMFFWLENCLPGMIVVNVDNENGMAIATSSNNMMMYCPGEPSDDLIIQLLHAKLSAISNGSLFIGEITLDSQDSSAGYTYALDKEGYSIPARVSDYIDMTSLHKKPWWHRSDGFSFEFLKPKGSKSNIVDLYSDVMDPLQEYENMLLSTPNKIKDKKPAEIIHVDKWKPKTV